MASQEIAHNRPQGLSNVMIEDARIFFRNFAGREGQYNQPGDRNFGLALPPDAAEKMRQDGWNVKQLRAREEGDTPQDWVPVSVSYKNRPPRVVMIAEKYNRETDTIEPVRTTIPEALVEMLDYADTSNIDVMINPYVYNFNGRSGVKAYLASIYVTIRMDALEKKYAAIPEVAFDGGALEIADHQFDEGIIDGEILEDEVDG